MKTPWQALLLVYRHLDVRLELDGGQQVEFRHELSELGIADALTSFSACPNLVAELSEGEASMVPHVAFARDPLRHLSKMTPGTFWPSPADSCGEIHSANRGEPCHSLFVLWPQGDIARERAIPSRGWGLGMGTSAQFPSATYATVANAPTRAWEIPRPGEVWLHEWLHGVCGLFRTGGCLMPDGDADGGGRHGYVQSSTTGWCDFYRDLMTGRVREDGILKGITADHWRAWNRVQRARLPAGSLSPEI